MILLTPLFPALKAPEIRTFFVPTSPKENVGSATVSKPFTSCRAVPNPDLFGKLIYFPIDGIVNNAYGAVNVASVALLGSTTRVASSAPTMAPLTSRQVESWSLPTEGIKALTSVDIAAWTIPMPGTAGSAQYKWPNKDAN